VLAKGIDSLQEQQIVTGVILSLAIDIFSTTDRINQIFWKQNILEAMISCIAFSKTLAHFDPLVEFWSWKQEENISALTQAFLQWQVNYPY